MNQQTADDILSVLQAGSITAAAKAMYISQSALSQRIKRAEEDLGTPLLDRGSVPIALTYAGEKYLEAMQRIAGITTTLLNELHEIEEEERGRMRLGISLQRGMQLLPLVIPAFVQRYPRVRIDLMEHGSATLERMLHDGLCDVALITTEPRYTDLKYDLLETEEVVLIASVNSPFAQAHEDQQEVPITAAREERFVSLQQGHSVRAFQDALFHRHQMDPPILLETDSLEAAKRLAAEGAALMLCPNIYVTQSPEVFQQVRCFRVKDISYRRHFYFGHRKDMALTRFMIDFRDLVKEKLRSAAKEAT